MQVNQLKLGSILSYAQMALSILIGLLYAPVMIRLLGQSEFGLYQTAAATIAMLSILSLGFNSGYVRFFARYRLANDDESTAKLNGLFLQIFLAIGAVAFLCGLYLTRRLDLVFDEGLTEREYRIAKVLMFLLTFNLATSFPMSVFASIISAHERFVFLKLLGMLKTVAGPLVTLPLLLLGYRSIAMVAASVALTLLADFAYVVYVFGNLKQKFVFRDYEKGLFKQLFAYSFFIALNLIVDQVNLNVAKVLLGRYQGTSAVAVYSVSFLLYSYYMTFSTSVSGVFTPRIHKIVNENLRDLSLQRKRLTELFVKVGRIQYIVLGLIATGLIFFGKSFIAFWAGEGYEESYPAALLLILPATVPLIQNLGIEIQRAQNRHQFRSIVYIFMAAINFGASIYLCQRYGVIGATLGTAGAFLLANGLVLNIYYHKKCNIDMFAFWKSIFQLSKGLIVPAFVGVLIMRYVDATSVVSFLLAIAVYAVVYCASMRLLGMNAEEKALIDKPLRLVKNKIFRTRKIAQ